MIGWVALGFIFFSVSALAKNKIEDEITVRSDSFRQYDSLFKRYGSRWGVDWKWLKAIAMNESSLGEARSVKRGIENPNDIEGSKSSDGKSWGLMQMTLPTLHDFDPDGTAADLNDPEYSVDHAAQFMRWVMRQFNSSDARFEEWCVKSYNQGVGNTRKEIRGEINGYAQSYWERYSRNRRLIESKQPGE